MEAFCMQNPNNNPPAPPAWQPSSPAASLCCHLSPGWADGTACGLHRRTARAPPHGVPARAHRRLRLCGRGVGLPCWWAAVARGRRACHRLGRGAAPVGRPGPRWLPVQSALPRPSGCRLCRSSALALRRLVAPAGSVCSRCGRCFWCWCVCVCGGGQQLQCWLATRVCARLVSSSPGKTGRGLCDGWSGAAHIRCALVVFGGSPSVGAWQSPAPAASFLRLTPQLARAWHHCSSVSFFGAAMPECQAVCTCMQRGGGLAQRAHTALVLAGAWAGQHTECRYNSNVPQHHLPY
jgi:hypothetical protein